MITIITVSYQAGNKLHKTIHSILKQTYRDYEIIIKDGKSTDGSVEMLLQDSAVAKELASGRIRLFVKEDQGVYDGMNQAIREAKGDYLLFLNCGDTLCGSDVLEKAMAQMTAVGNTQNTIFYGDTFCEQSGSVDTAPPAIDEFQCFRNLPCHQATIYTKDLFTEKQYDTSLKIRADYDHFLWCYFIKHTRMVYLQMTIANYEGGGISENTGNEALDKTEHLTVLRRYLPEQQIRKYQTIMMLTLAPVRKKIANSKVLSGVYQKMKKALQGNGKAVQK